MLDSVKARSDLILQKMNDSLFGEDDEIMIFSKNEIKKASIYVPRWPLFTHIIAAVVMHGLSSYYHLFDHMDE